MEAQPPGSYAPRSNNGLVVAILSALCVFALSLVPYYMALGVVALFTISSALGGGGSADPPGFNLVMTAVVNGGLVWAGAAATSTYRSVRHGAPRQPWTFMGDALTVVGVGLMTAVLGLWPSILASEQDMSSTAMTGAVGGFILGSVAAGVLVVVKRNRRYRAHVSAESAAT